jgi:hypothetical protein
MAAMLSAENMRRPSSCQCSSCYSSTAPTRRVIAASLGKTVYCALFLMGHESRKSVAFQYPFVGGCAGP